MSSFLKKVRVLAKRQFKNEYEMDAYIDSIESSEQIFRAEIWRDGDRIMCEFTKGHERYHLPVDLKLDITKAFDAKDMSWVTGKDVAEGNSVDFDATFDLSERKFKSIYLDVPKGRKLDAMKILDLKAPGGKTVREVLDAAIGDFHPYDDEDTGTPDGFDSDRDYYRWRFGK